MTVVLTKTVFSVTESPPDNSGKEENTVERIHTLSRDNPAAPGAEDSFVCVDVQDQNDGIQIQVNNLLTFIFHDDEVCDWLPISALIF